VGGSNNGVRCQRFAGNAFERCGTRPTYQNAFDVCILDALIYRQVDGGTIGYYFQWNFFNAQIAAVAHSFVFFG
jgi:hypothetical protein